MPSLRHDQAEGLRRLLDRSGMRVVSVNAGTVGSIRNWAIVNLAGALAEAGSDVLILDANPAAHSVTTTLGLCARFDLEDVLRRERELDDVILRGPGGIHVLPFTRGAQALARLPLPQQQWLVQRCARVGLLFDTLVLDAAAGGADTLPRSGIASREIIVLAGGGAQAVTEAYATVKRLYGEFARREFHILVSHVASEVEARSIFGHLARVARRYLRVSLDFLGHVPIDDKLKHATHLRLPVVAAFPDTPAAIGFRCLAQAISDWPRAAEEGHGFDHVMRQLLSSGQPDLGSAASGAA